MNNENELMEKHLMTEHQESFWKRLTYLIPDMLSIFKNTNKVSRWIETEGTKLWKKRWEYNDSEYEAEVDKLVDQMIQFIKSETDGSVYQRTALKDNMSKVLRQELKREKK